jgi:energy-coupling factor transporter ATP-binding protein EcfA2
MQDRIDLWCKDQDVTIEADIIAWALTRPAWQQDVLVSLASGSSFTEEQFEALVDDVLSGDRTAPSQEAKSIAPKPDAAHQVSLRALTEVVGVNALISGQTLEFGSTGLTIVYGDNASGKSGYARLIKAMVDARHSSDVLPDVFDEGAPQPTAVLRYAIAETELQHTFPSAPTPQMRQMRFYDEHCGDEYLTKESTISYRPSALSLLDELIQTCDRVRTAISDRMTALQSGALNLGIAADTTAGAFVAKLSAKTTDQAIDKATAEAPGAGERLAEVLQKEARLNASNPQKEKTRLENLAKTVSELKTVVEGLIGALAADKTAERARLGAAAVGARTAATMAAANNFDDVPLSGVGSETWRRLWEAARQYSAAEAYPAQDFPVTVDGAHCVLCQQTLEEAAQDRLDRFDRYMADTTQRDARRAEASFAATVDDVSALLFSSVSLSEKVAAVKAHDLDLGTEAEQLLTTLAAHRDRVLTYLTDDGADPGALPLSAITSRLDEMAVALDARATSTDTAQFAADLAAVTKERAELQARTRLCETRQLVKDEVGRLKKLEALKAARSAADTSSMTQKSSALTREYATKMILDEFTRETERLQLRRVTLDDLGGRKGQLTQRPGLLGATRGTTTRTVLSEGEQTALGLAGFFTEATFDKSKSAVIFDDPVTSLDHVRRDKVAQRLAQLAADRQVVVFTHDVAFVGNLTASAESEGITVHECSIERRGPDPGVCVQWLPWKAKDFGSRVDHLRTELAKLTRERPTLLQDEYEERVATWAGYLSETWERCVTTEVLNQVFDRGTSHVLMQKFRVLASVTDGDDQDLQEGYGATSKWGRRHDKSVETNYVAPEPDDLEAEFKRLVEWQKRVKKYR